MRILQVIDILAPVGGAQRSVLDTIDLLVGAGHEVAALHWDEGVGHDRVLSARCTDPDMAEFARDFDPEVIHVHASVPAPVEPLLRERCGVHSLHNFAFACSTGSKYFRDGTLCTRSHGPGCLVVGPVRGCLHRPDPRQAVARFRLIQRELPRLGRAAGIVVHSRFMRDVALQNGLPGNRVSVVPLFTSAGPGEFAYGGERIVAFAGRITPEKGLDVLIEALSRRPEAWDELLVAGDGWDRNRCERLARDRGIGDRVGFLRHLAHEGVRELFTRARVVAVPSRWPEPFGLVGLEAMSVGRPVVATAVGGIPEWLDDGRTGILVPPGDPDALGSAIASLLEDPARAARLGAEGRRQVERFSPDAHLESLVAVYERAAAGAHRPESEARVA